MTDDIIEVAGGQDEPAAVIIREAEEDKARPEPEEDDPGVVIRLVPSQERMERMATGILMDIETSFLAQCRFLARFMVNSNGTYMKEDQALDIIRKVPMNQTAKAAENLMEALRDKAVPKG